MSEMNRLRATAPIAKNQHVLADFGAGTISPLPSREVVAKIDGHEYPATLHDDGRITLSPEAGEAASAHGEVRITLIVDSDTPPRVVTDTITVPTKPTAVTYEDAP